MADITHTSSSETEVSHFEGETDLAVEFIDCWEDTAMMVVDSGRIILPSSSVGRFEKAARADGLTIETVEGL